MNITFAPRGILQIDNARITYRNFSGIGNKFNREGDRNFSLIIEDGYVDNEPRSDQEICDILKADTNKYGVGWNVKVKKYDDGGVFMHLPVKLRFTDSTRVYLKTNDKLVELDEESVSMLDNIDISNVDLDIRPYDDTMVSGPFRAAYVQSICVTQNVDRFKARYED